MEYNRKTGKVLYEYQGSSSDSIIGFGYIIYDSYPCLVVCSKSGKIIVWRTVTHYKVLEKVCIYIAQNSYKNIFFLFLANTI